MLRATRRANASGNPSASVCGSTVIASAPASPAAKRRHRGPQHVHVRIALGQHSPRGFGGDEGWLGRKAAGRFNAGPQQAQRAEFRHRQELVGVGGEPERDRRAGGVKIDAAVLQHPQISDGQRQRECQFLDFRPARIMDRASVSQHKRTAKTSLHQPADHAGKRLCHLVPCGRGAAAHGHRAQCLIIEAQVDLGRIDAPLLRSVQRMSRRHCPVRSPDEARSKSRHRKICRQTAASVFPALRRRRQSRGRRARRQIRSRVRWRRSPDRGSPAHWQPQDPDDRSAA